MVCKIFHFFSRYSRCWKEWCSIRKLSCTILSRLCIYAKCRFNLLLHRKTFFLVSSFMIISLNLSKKRLRLYDLRPSIPPMCFKAIWRKASQVRLINVENLYAFRRLNHRRETRSLYKRLRENISCSGFCYFKFKRIHRKLQLRDNKVTAGNEIQRDQRGNL